MRLSSRFRFVVRLGLVVFAAVSARAQLPTGAQVVAGQAAITQAGNAMTITQASRNAIVNWQSFNLGAENTLRLQQAGADAAMLARVVGNDPSQLLGSLQADGKLFLINPNGIVVGQGAVIDTSAFLASTLDVSDDNFLRGGELALKGGSTAGIVNLGKITAREGNVMLFAHTVKNAGEINASNGTVGLGAGTEVLLASPDASSFVIKTNLSASAEKTGVENAGVIAAAQAQLEAAGGSIYELAVNQSGVVRATGSEIRNGRVLLTAAGGTVGVSGEISARNADGSGGEILVGGDYRGENAAVANAARTVVTATGKLDASADAEGVISNLKSEISDARSTSAGRVIVWADDATRFLGTLDAQGQGGGFAEVSGKRWLDFNPASTVQLGPGGTLLLDPDALIISADPDAGTSTSGANPFTFGATDEPATLNVTTLQNQLATSNVILDTSTSSGDITFEDAVTWATPNTLTVKSGNNINIYADITGGAGSTLALYTGRVAMAPGESSNPDIWGEATLDYDATITVGTLIYGANGDSAPGPDYTLDTPLGAGTFFVDGNLNVGTFELDLNHGSVGVTTNDDADNTIGAFRTSGDADFRAYVVNHHGNLDVTLHSTQVNGGYLQFITPGNLTLKSGSDLAFLSPGNVILASTAGAFINEAGAEVFDANTRFFIYTSTTAATTKGGLTGADVFNHPFDDADDYTGFDSTFFFSGASGSPILTYTADSFIRRYGVANPTFTYTVDGWLDHVTNDVTGTPALSAAATQSSGVGSYDITISAGTLASSNYDFSFEPGTLSITRAPLTITANDATRRVGVANPDFSVSYSGFVLGETASALGGTLAVTTPATTASLAGAYTIAPSGLTSANYNITFVPGTLTLTETAALLISANSTSRTYGATNPVFTASYSGFVGGEDESIVTGLQFSTEATQSSGIGLYIVTPFGATAPGYDIDYASGTLEILRAALTISVPNQSRLYGDENDFTVNYNGLVNGDTSAVVSGLSLATAATETSSVGNYAITASGATADNYSITYAQGTLSVAPAPLTVTIDPATRRYGDADPVFTYTLSGLKNGDSADLVTVANLDSLATPTANAGSYTIVGFPFSSSPNYSVAAQVTGTLTITPRPLTITVDDVMRTYGDPNPAFTATFDGLASFDTPAILGALNFSTQATQASGVGDWGIIFSTINSINYAITPQFGTLTIAPAPLTFQSLADLSRVYGRANPEMALPEVDGLKNSDTVASLGLAFDAPALNADAGTYTYRLTTTNPNYELASGTGLFRIDPAPLTVAITPTGRLYGEANPKSYAFTANGLAFGQSAASVLSINNPASLYSDVGVYSLMPVLNTGNYVITSITGGAFQINPRVVTLDLPYYARYYGDQNPVFFNADIAVGGDGLASFDSISSLVPELHTATPTTSLSNTGYYRIDPTFATNPNYRYSWTPGYLAVMPRPVEITVGDGVSFGNNNVPADFDAQALGVSLIIFDDEHLSGTGYSISMSNPAVGANLAELLSHVRIVLSRENTPQAVSVAVPLDQVPFPARPGYTPPVSASDPLPEEDLGIKTIQLSQYMPEPPETTPTTIEDLLRNVVYSGGQFIADFTGEKKEERFADVIRYLLAEPSLGGNYVVTAIHNGKLTMKADPIVVQHTLDAEAAYKQLKDAREALLTGVTTAGGGVQRTFNLTQAEFPLIQEAFANLLFDLVRSDRSNPLLQELTGLSSVVNMEQISPDAIALWLADIHSNPYKQRMLMPAMAAYGVKIAGLTPAQRTPLQQQLVDRMTPALKAARNDLIDRAVAAQEAWGEMQYGNTNMTTLMGAEVPYEKFVSSAVQQTMESAYSSKYHDTDVLSETEMTKMIGLAAAGTTGATTGAVMAKIAMHSIESIFPKIKSGLLVAMDKADEVAQLALKASKYTRMGNTANAVFGIVSTAVTVGIEKAIAVANEGVQKEKFEALIASRNDPIDPHAMTDTDQGRAVLLAGLMTMFGGG